MYGSGFYTLKFIAVYTTPKFTTLKKKRCTYAMNDYSQAFYDFMIFLCYRYTLCHTVDNTIIAQYIQQERTIAHVQ